MTPVEFTACTAVLETAVGRELTGPQAKVWYTVLGDLTREQLEVAVVRCLREYKYAGFPPLGVLRSYAGCSEPAALPVSDRAVVAWDRVVDAIRRIGGYQTVEFDDPAINAAVRTLGGWNTLCEIETEELHRFVRQRFAEAYRAHSACGIPADNAAALPGIIAEDAGRDGFPLPIPVCVSTGLPASDVKVIGEVAHRALPSPETARIVGELVKHIDTSAFADEDTVVLPAKPLPSAAEQRAALLAKYGSEM